jgi:hypothetical protein
MSDRDNVPRNDDELARALIASSCTERPAEGARGRAFDAVVHELGAQQAALAPSAPRRSRRRGLAAVGALGAFALLGTGLFLKHKEDEAAALRARYEELAAELQRESDSVNQVRAELTNTKDPERIAALQQQLALAQQQTEETKSKAVRAAGREGRGKGVEAAPGRGVAGAPASKPVRSAACNCTPGDPLCSCL